MTGAKIRFGAFLRAWLCTATLLVMAVGTIHPARAQHMYTQQADVDAVIVTPLSFQEVESLHFGSILASNAAGTVTIAPNGTRTRTGGITLAGGTPHPANFAGMGSPNQRVDISLGANAIWIYGTGVRMRVRNFIIGSTPTAVLTTTPRRFRIASVNGIFNFPVGATLDVGASQLPGIYTGTWNITLNYQ